MEEGIFLQASKEEQIDLQENNLVVLKDEQLSPTAWRLVRVI